MGKDIKVILVKNFEYMYANIFTISGVGVGSSKEELLRTFTNFDKEGDVDLEGENEEFFMYIDETTLEFVTFYCLEGAIITISIGYSISNRIWY